MTEHHDDYTEPEGFAPPPEEYQEEARPRRREREHDRDRPRRGGRPSGERRSRDDRPRRGFRPREEEEEIDPRIAEMIRATEEKLDESYRPVQIENLNPFERKQFHRHFERRKSSYQTKTYRNEENHVLWIFPVGNLKRFLTGKAQEVILSGEDLALPPMSSYERFLAHNILKELGTVDSVSEGEGEERHLVLQPKKIEPPAPSFGRTMRKVAKKIKLM